MNKMLKAAIWAAILILVIVGSSFTYSALKNAPSASDKGFVFEPQASLSGTNSIEEGEGTEESSSLPSESAALPSESAGAGSESPASASPSAPASTSPSPSKGGSSPSSSPSGGASPSASSSPSSSPSASPSPSKGGSSPSSSPSGSVSPSPSPSKSEEPDDGRSPAPDFTVYNRSGKKVSLSGMKGKPVVINVWATWCPYCVKELPYFEALYQEYGGSVSFMMVDAVGTNGETVEKGKKYVDDNGFTFPVYFDSDSEAVETYGVVYYPTTIFVDANGNIARIVKGALTKEDLRTYIKEILK